MTMEVTRVREGNHTWIEPPLDNSWDDLTRLRWHAAVTEHDCGVSVRVERPTRLTEYNVLVGGSSIAPLNFTEAWSFITGVSIGAAQSHREETR